MRRILLALLSLGLIAGMTLPAWAHGGTYRGPQDTVPPGAGAPSGPTTPGPAGPAGPSAPTTGGPAAPNAPNAPAPATGGPPTPTSAAPRTGGAGIDLIDLSTWEFWWEFNKEPFLNLKAAIHRGAPVTGSDDFFMGRGRRNAADSLRPTNEQIETLVKPALIEALKNETNNDIVTGCLIALGKIGNDPTLVEIITEKLKSKNQEISETAGVALGILADTQAFDTLVNLATDTKDGRSLLGRSQTPARTAAFATYGLGLIGYATNDPAIKEQIISTLIEIYKKDRSASRDIKVATLTALGLCQDPKEKNLEEGETDAGSGPSMIAVEFLRKVLADSKEHKITRAHAPIALAKLTGPSHPLANDLIKQFSLILRNKKSPDFVRQSSVMAIGMLARPGMPMYEEALKTIKQNVKSARNEQERNFNMIALGKMGGPDPQHFLVKTLTDKRTRGSMRPWAGMALAVLGRNIANEGGSVDSIIPDKLLEMLQKGGNPAYVGAYAIALGILQETQAKELLMKTMVKVGDESLKGYCAVALGLIGNRDSIEEIRKLVRSSTRKPGLLQQASIGLGLLGDKNLVLELVEMLKDAKGLAVQAALASALGFIGDQRSIKPLIDLLKNKKVTAVARGFSAVALGLVCDKEKLPWNSKIAVDINYRATTQTLNDASSGTGILNIL